MRPAIYIYKVNARKCPHFAIFDHMTPTRVSAAKSQIPPAAAANQIADNVRIPPAADLQKNKAGKKEVAM